MGPDKHVFGLTNVNLNAQDLNSSDIRDYKSNRIQDKEAKGSRNI